MLITFFGGLVVAGDRSRVRGRGQEALLCRLALDAGSTVGYRALAEDIWPFDAPEDPRASLQSLVSRLRRALPDGVLESSSHGYRLTVPREEIDVARFQDLVADAIRSSTLPDEAARMARDALALWVGDPWLPDGFDWALRDLLEDRARAEQIARSASPLPPAAADHAPRAPLTSLVGRDEELELIAEQIGAERLVTILGPGGVGKTSLALETVHGHPAAVVVELAPVTGGEVWAAVAGAVDRSISVSDTSTAVTTPRDRTLRALAGRDVLVVLDNCEHVSEEAARVAEEILLAASSIRILTTSREPLGLPGEAFVPLGPLPDADAEELFRRRVRAARGRAPEPADAAAVGRIVQRLDGLPLALELAAARARTLTIEEIDTGLDDRFALLSRGPRAAAERHQTLRALIDWSWETLTGPERSALLAVSIFPDGVGASDAAVMAEGFGIEPADLDALVDRSLLRRAHGRYRMLETVREYGLQRLQAEGDGDDTRVRQARILTTLAVTHDRALHGPGVREALAWFDSNEENLSTAIRFATGTPDVGLPLVNACLWAWVMRERVNELSTGLAAHAEHARRLDSPAAVTIAAVALAEPTLRLLPGSASGAVGAPAREPGGASAIPLSIDEVEARVDEIAVAVRRHPSDVATVLVPLLRGALRGVKEADGGSAWRVGFAIAPEDPPGASEWARTCLSLVRAALAQNVGGYDELGVQSERALDGFRRLGDVWGIAMAAQMRAEWLMLRGRLEEALEVADSSTAALQGLSTASDLIQQHSLAVTVLTRLGRMDEASRRQDELDDMARSDGSSRALTQAAMTGAQIDLAAGDGAAALRRLDAARLDPAVRVPPQVLAWSGAQRARALVLEGRVDEAGDQLRQSLPIAVQSSDHPIIADAALVLAAWLLEVRRDDDARSALRESVRLRGHPDASDPYYLDVCARLGESPTGAPGDVPAAPVDLLAMLA